MSGAAPAWFLFLHEFGRAFTLPSAALFGKLVTAWVLCPGRHTVTRMIGVMDPKARHPHDAFHRFLRVGEWDMEELWRLLNLALAASLAPRGAMQLDLDDTLFHKSGRKVEGAGVFRDAVRSTSRHVVHALGLNLVVLTLRIVPPWGGEPLGLPISMRMYRKGGPSHLDLAEAMIRQAAEWFLNRTFRLACDGAYASLAGRALPRTQVTSRMRRDAAVYNSPPPRPKGKRGRPAKKGLRLPTPLEMASAHTQGWMHAIVTVRGKSELRLVFARTVLWYKTCPNKMVLLVIVRDPTGKQRDDFFFSTDLSATPEEVLQEYGGRWSIEDTFRNVKQFLGGEDPQNWKGQGPERAAAISFWIYSAVWKWYIEEEGMKRTWPRLPWYPGKRAPSFLDALASLRCHVWRYTILSGSASHSLLSKKEDMLIEILSRAA